MSESNAGWTPTTLGEVCAINPPRPKLAGRADNEQVMFVPMAAVDDVSGEIRSAEDRCLGEVRAKSYRTFTSGDVIFAKITPCMENGKAAVVPGIPSGLGFGSTEFHVLRPGPDVSARLIWHYVRQESFRNTAEANLAGSVGQARVPVDFLRSYPITLPPRALQDQIAKILDRTTATARSANSHLASARAAVERFRQAVLAAACSGRLTADWRAEYGYEEKYADEQEIPTSWHTTNLASLAQNIRGGSTEVPIIDPTNFPVLRSSSVRPFKVDLSDVRFLRESQSQREDYFLEDGDLLITRLSGSVEYVGNCALVRSLDGARIQYPDRLFRCRLHDSRESAYVELAFAGPRMRRQIEAASRSAAGHQRISISDLKAFSIERPPLEEQQVITERVAGLLKQANETVARLDKAERLMSRTSQAVLAKAFRGELVS